MIEDSVYFKTVNDKFPTIGKKIKVFWGYPEFVALIHELQQDTGDRFLSCRYSGVHQCTTWL